MAAGGEMLAPGDGSQPIQTLDARDLAGRVVRVLLDGDCLPSGRHRANWDGRTDRGLRVGAGVYFYRLEAGGLVETRRVALVK